MQRKCTWIVATLLLVALLCGCGGARLYSEVRDKQGIATKDAWSKVDLNSIVATDRDNLQKVLKSQLDTQDQVASAYKTYRLRQILRAESASSKKCPPPEECPSAKNGLFALISGELNEILGEANSDKAQKALLDKLADAIEAKTKYEASLYSEARVESGYGIMGYKIPTCDSIKSEGDAPDDIADYINKHPLGDDRSVKLRGLIEQQRKYCEQKRPDPFAAFTEGTLTKAIVQKVKDTEELATAERENAPLRDDYKAALKEYNDAVKAAAPSGAQVAAIAPDPTAASSSGKTTCADAPSSTDTFAAKAGAAAHKLCVAVEALDKAKDALSIQLLSKDRLDSLDKFVTTVTEAETDGKLPNDASKGAVAYVLLPKLVDDARDSLANAKKPLITPFLLRRDIEKLKLDGSTKEIEIRKTRVQFSSAIVDALFAQASQLKRALEQKDHLGSLYTEKTAAEAYSSNKAKPEEKQALYMATALYLDAINRLWANKNKLEYQRISTFHEVSLAYAEVNLKQWNTLIGTSVDQVAESAGGGIKLESITALINTAGILYIGHGVNK